jgi:hypothetical protein
MFLLRVNVFSNDKQHTIKATSKNIRITSFNISDNSLYYNNLEMKFNGTFNQSEKYSYIAKIYNYFLENYNAELIGPIDSLSGSILFGGGLDLSNLTATSLLIDGTINQTEIILPGTSLVWFLLDDYINEFNQTGRYLSPGIGFVPNPDQIVRFNLKIKVIFS